MHYDERSTVCVSSQAGCAMGCGFCATGQAGFDRHLDVGEIVEQVDPGPAGGAGPAGLEHRVHGHGRAARQLRRHDRCGPSAARRPRPVGPGHHDLDRGCRPGMRRLAEEDLPVGLALSLHAANDELRDRLVPLNRRYPLAELAEAAQHLPAGPQPPPHARVGPDRRHQRPGPRRRRAGRLRPPAAGPRQPDPAEPDAGLPHRGLAARTGPGLRRRAASGRGQRHRAPHPRPRDRCRLRSAAGHGRRGPHQHGRAARSSARRRPVAPRPRPEPRPTRPTARSRRRPLPRHRRPSGRPRPSGSPAGTGPGSRSPRTDRRRARPGVGPAAAARRQETS